MDSRERERNEKLKIPLMSYPKKGTLKTQDARQQENGGKREKH